MDSDEVAQPHRTTRLWTPFDIEEYLMHHNKEDNMRLGFLSSEDMEIAEWKRATGVIVVFNYLFYAKSFVILSV